MLKSASQLKHTIIVAICLYTSSLNYLQLLFVMVCNMQRDLCVRSKVLTLLFLI